MSESSSSLWNRLRVSALFLLRAERQKRGRDGGERERARDEAMAAAMEIGSEVDPSSATFSLTDEDHTLGNSLRYILNKDPRVSFCGYSVPHPSEARVNIRVQTTGAPARDVLKDALHDLMAIGEHVRTTFERALEQHKVTRSLNEMSMRSGLTSQHTSGSVRDQ